MCAKIFIVFTYGSPIASTAVYVYFKSLFLSLTARLSERDSSIFFAYFKIFCFAAYTSRTFIYNNLLICDGFIPASSGCCNWAQMRVSSSCFSGSFLNIFLSLFLHLTLLFSAALVCYSTQAATLSNKFWGSCYSKTLLSRLNLCLPSYFLGPPLILFERLSR